jgi:hypothetical protein
MDGFQRELAATPLKALKAVTSMGAYRRLSRIWMA